MKMHGVVLICDNDCVLQHYLYPGSLFQLRELSYFCWLPQATAHIVCIIKLYWRNWQKICSENTSLALVVTLHQGVDPGKYKRGIVHACGKMGSIRTLAMRAVRICAVDEP